MSGGAHVGPGDDAATQVARQAKQEVAIVEALQITAIGKAEDLQRPVFTAGVGRGGGTARPCAEQERDKQDRSDEHTSELQSLMRIPYAVFCLKKKKTKHSHHNNNLQIYNKT